MNFISLENAKSGVIVVLALMVGYLMYSRPASQVQVAKTSEVSVRTSEDTSHITSTITTVTETTREPNGKIVVKSAKVFQKIADKRSTAAEHSSKDSSSVSTPGLSQHLARFSLGVDFSPHLSASNPLQLHAIDLGYRVIGPAWATSQITLEAHPKVTIGLRLEF